MSDFQVVHRQISVEIFGESFDLAAQACEKCAAQFGMSKDIVLAPDQQAGEHQAVDRLIDKVALREYQFDAFDQKLKKELVSAWAKLIAQQSASGH